MNRIKYQYQLLRYLPDRISGEFANVGLVLYIPEQGILKAQTITKFKRLSLFFGELNGHYLIHTLHQIQKQLEIRAKRFEEEFRFTETPELFSITSEVLQPDDSALFFTPVQLGLDVSADRAWHQLTQRFLAETEEEHRVSDKEVWQKLYKDFFDKRGLLNKLHAQTIQTPTDSLHFDLVFKNGHLNCLEPANFDLKTEENIREKVNKIIGKWDALSQSDELIDYHILAKSPDDFPNLKIYIQKRLSNRTIGKATLHLITPENAEDFVEKVAQDLQLSTV